MMIWRRLPVRIHIWGGLGSQLYGWALAIILQHSLGRKITLIFHSSGVTQREPELYFISDSFKVEIIEDFVPTAEPRNEEWQKRDFVRKAIWKTIRWLLTQSRISLSQLSEIPTGDIRPWTFSLRGHYSNIQIPDWVHGEMIQQASNRSLLQKKLDLLDTTLIHYRLGDLLKLEGKPPLDPSRFSNIHFDNSPIAVISDSLEIAQKRLKDILGQDIEVVRSSTGWQTLSAILSSKTFIGTPSKISFWGIAWRLHTKPNSISMLPTEYTPNLINLVGRHRLSRIHTF